MDKDDDKQASSTYLLHKILKKDSENKLPDEMLPLSSLRSDSPEFIKRINEENFWYLMELTEIYLINMANARDRQINERNRNAVLMEYQQQLERNKKFFESLVLSDRMTAEKLMLAELKKLELLNQKLDTTIHLLNDQIKLVDVAIAQMDSKIQNLNSTIKNQNAAIAAHLKNYAAVNVPIKNAKRMTVPLHLTPEELAQSPKNWPNHLILGEDTVRKIINQAADKILKEEFSFENQSNNMQDIAREVLKNEVLNACSFLPIEQREKCLERFMNSHDAASAIQNLAMMVNDHIADMDAKNNFKLKSEQAELAANMVELKQALIERKSLIEMRETLVTQKEELIKKKEEIESHTDSLSGKEVDKMSDSLDDIFGNAAEVQAVLASYSEKSQEKKDDQKSSPTMRL